MKWEVIDFGELYLIPSKNGLNRPGRVRGQGYKMINMGELFANDRIENISMELVPMNEKEIESYSIIVNDLLFARQSLVLSGAGKCSIVVEVQGVTTFESHIIRVRLNPLKAVPLFYYYYFKSPGANIQSLVQHGVQAGIRGTELKFLSVSYPPLDTQRKIASILSAYDDLIENNLRRIKLLEEAAQQIYKEWFVNFRFPGYENTKFVDGLPEGWRKITLNDVADVTMGQSPESIHYNTKNEGLPFHQGVTNFSKRFIKHTIYCTQTTRTAEYGDILFSVRAPVGRINLTNRKIIIGRGLCAIRHKRNFQYFLYYQLQDRFYKEDMLGGGAIFNSVKKNELLNVELIDPHTIILKEFEGMVKPIENQISNLIYQNDSLKQARDILLPKLMSGEIEV